MAPRIRRAGAKARAVSSRPCSSKDVAIVLNAIVGAAGLDATLAAVRAGKRVALANKETLVVAGELVAAACRAGGGEIVPVDSEHSAILQCIAGRPATDIRRLLITASGGPFRDWTQGAPRARDASPMRCSIPRGAWAARSRSTARRSRTRRSR